MSPVGGEFAPGLAGRRSGDYTFILAVAYALVIGLAAQLFFVLRTDFPLNDGGLFYSMVRDLG